MHTCLGGQDLYQRCEKMRPTLFRLASDTEDNDEALGERHAFSSVIKQNLKVRIPPWSITLNFVSLFEEEQNPSSQG